MPTLESGAEKMTIPICGTLIHHGTMISDYDGAWKDLLHSHFREVMECYFPLVAVAIDWETPWLFLEQELHQLHITEEGTANRVDLLVEVCTLEGETQTIYLHIEVQSFPEQGFADRLHRYFQGLCQSTGRDVVTLAILADLQADWKPCSYEYSRLGCEVSFRFPVCKLLERLPELETSDSLPALAALAQIEALKTSSNPDQRLAARWRITRRLLELGYPKEKIRTSLRLIAWMLHLPKRQALQFRQKIVDFDQMNATAYVTDIEELAIEKGIEKGIEQGIEQGIEKGQAIARQRDILEVLEIRFGRVPVGLREEINNISDSHPLQSLLREAIRCSDLETFAHKL